MTDVLISVDDSDRLERFAMQEHLDAAGAVGRLLDLAETHAPRVAAVRAHFRADEELPEWEPEQWIAAVNIKLGEAAHALHAQLYRDRREAGIDPTERAEGVECLLAVAAICMDAVEMLEGQGGGADD